MGHLKGRRKRRKEKGTPLSPLPPSFLTSRRFLFVLTIHYAFPTYYRLEQVTAIEIANHNHLLRLQPSLEIFMPKGEEDDGLI